VAAICFCALVNICRKTSGVPGVAVRRLLLGGCGPLGFLSLFLSLFFSFSFPFPAPFRFLFPYLFCSLFFPLSFLFYLSFSGPFLFVPFSFPSLFFALYGGGFQGLCECPQPLTFSTNCFTKKCKQKTIKTNENKGTYLRNVAANCFGSGLSGGYLVMQQRHISILCCA
jgi:hypothetical protein